MNLHQKGNNESFILLAHGLKTNITATKWLLHMIEKGEMGPLTEEQKSALATIRDANNRMLSSIHESLFLHKNGIEEQIYEFKHYDITSLITETILHIKGEATKKNVLINFEADKSMIIEVDHEKIRIVIQNLFENALKYCYPNTKIYCHIECAHNLFHFSITNEGIGIPPEEQKNIFSHYYRGSNAEKYAHGTGIGLYGAQQIIKKHGGVLSFESEIGGKTTFHFSLPIYQKHDK